MKFTKAAVEALPLPTGASPAFFWDDGLPGFGVKLNPGGSRQWVAQYRTPDGRTPRTTIGRVNTVSLDDARKQARMILAKAQTGHDPQAEKAAAKKQASITLGFVADAYLKRAKTRLKPRSYEETKRHLLKDWKPLADRPLASIKRADVAAHLNIVSDGKPVAGNRARAALSAMFTWAMGEGLSEINPVVGTNKPAEETSRERILTAVELKAIWDSAGDDDYGTIIKLLILTGQRRDEVGALNEGELDLASGMWTIPGGKATSGRTTKNSVAQEVPLSPLAISLIEEKPRQAGRALLFGRGSKGFSGWSASKKRLDARIAAAGIKVNPWRLHDLRRTAATTMAENLSVQPHVIESILNHVSGHKAGPAGIYNRATYRNEKRDALDRWADFVVSL